MNRTLRVYPPDADAPRREAEYLQGLADRVEIERLKERNLERMLDAGPAEARRRANPDTWPVPLSADQVSAPAWRKPPLPCVARMRPIRGDVQPERLINPNCPVHGDADVEERAPKCRCKAPAWQRAVAAGRLDPMKREKRTGKGMLSSATVKDLRGRRFEYGTGLDVSEELVQRHREARRRGSM